MLQRIVTTICVLIVIWFAGETFNKSMQVAHQCGVTDGR